MFIEYDTDLLTVFSAPDSPTSSVGTLSEGWAVETNTEARVLPPEDEPDRGRKGWFDKTHDFIPNRCSGTPKDIGGAALFLASELGEYVNGETIVVDGGLYAGVSAFEGQTLDGAPGWSVARHAQ